MLSHVVLAKCEVAAKYMQMEGSIVTDDDREDVYLMCASVQGGENRVRRLLAGRREFIIRSFVWASKELFASLSSLEVGIGVLQVA